MAASAQTSNSVLANPPNPPNPSTPSNAFQPVTLEFLIEQYSKVRLIIEDLEELNAKRAKHITRLRNKKSRTRIKKHKRKLDHMALQAECYLDNLRFVQRNGPKDMAAFGKAIMEAEGQSIRGVADVRFRERAAEAIEEVGKWIDKTRWASAGVTDAGEYAYTQAKERPRCVVQ